MPSNDLVIVEQECIQEYEFHKREQGEAALLKKLKKMQNPLMIVKKMARVLYLIKSITVVKPANDKKPKGRFCH